MNIHILLLDDDMIRGKALRELLIPLGYTVVEVNDTAKAIARLTDETFDLIILDITLPDKKGMLLLDHLTMYHINSKVIVITGTTAMEETINAETAKQWDFITKPFNPGFFLQFVAYILSDTSINNHRLQIIHAGEFIKSTPTGDLDLAASKKGFAQIAEAAAHLQSYTVLIDLREVNSHLTITTIYQLASELDSYGITFRRKSAILIGPDNDLQKAMFFETAAMNQGFNVKVFTQFENAVVWLSTIVPPKIKS